MITCLQGGPRVRVAIAWLVALVAGTLTYVLADVAYRALPRPQSLEELSYYPSGESLTPATLGHATTAADLAWLRAVQYYGQHRMTDNQYLRMAHVFDVLTTLDPAFKPAYVFGAFALAQEGRDFAAAERLMLNGLAANPTSGELAFKLGFLYYVRPGGRDLNHAAEYFEQASRQPDGPPESARFAAFARQNCGDLAVAYELWSQVKRSSPNRYLQDIAGKEMDRIHWALARNRRDLAVRRLSTPQVLILNRP